MDTSWTWSLTSSNGYIIFLYTLLFQITSLHLFVKSPLHLNAFEIWFLFERKEERREKNQFNFQSTRVPEYVICPVTVLSHSVYFAVYLFGFSLYHAQLGFVPFLLVLMRLWDYWWNLLKLTKWKKREGKKTESRGMVIDSLASFALVCCWDLTLSLLSSNDTYIGFRRFLEPASGADCLQFCISQHSHGSPLSQFFITILSLLGVFHKDATMWLGGGEFLSLGCEEYDSL